jgi:COP9 signalosome complex subunit 5
MGWYHSHPFDLGELSHCFLSQTDLSTQLQWQRAEDPHGNPFVAIVLDPLRSAHIGTPELKAFRAYPPDYQSSIANECPDGSVESSEQARLERWGSCWNRYYELGVEYYMSSTSRKILGDLTQNYLWMASFKRQDETAKVKSLQDVAVSMKANSLGIAPSSSTSAVESATSAAVAAASTVGPSSFLLAENVATMSGVSSRDFQPTATKIQNAATQELVQATLRNVQRKVFQTPASDVTSIK